MVVCIFKEVFLQRGETISSRSRVLFDLGELLPHLTTVPEW
jgi:hypothetical protein